MRQTGSILMSPDKKNRDDRFALLRELQRLYVEQRLRDEVFALPVWLETPVSRFSHSTTGRSISMSPNNNFVLNLDGSKTATRRDLIFDA